MKTRKHNSIIVALLFALSMLLSACDDVTTVVTTVVNAANDTFKATNPEVTVNPIDLALPDNQ